MAAMNSDATNPRRGVWCSIFALSLSLCVTGCATSQSGSANADGRSPRGEPSIAIDSVADRLHDISGSILLFYNAYHRLPESLNELCLVTGLSPRQVNDPATDKPFTYRPQGLGQFPGGGVIVLAAAPQGTENDAGNRWCVVIDTTTQAPVCRVLLLPPEALAMPAPETPR